VLVPTTAEILARIDLVLRQNRRIEWLLILLTSVLFCVGIACFVVALVTGKFAWSTPAAITTGLLYWPLQEIKDIRAKNIALATVPLLITQLPKAKAAEELQKLLETLRGGKRP
jgi:hypothetical protein